MAIRPIDKLHIASPCHEDWTNMTGEGRARHCSACDQTVYNITAMTRTEAQDFINSAEGRVCVRLYRRQDGTVLTRDCRAGSPSELVELRRAGVRLGILGGLLAATAMSPKIVRKLVSSTVQGALVSDFEPVPRPFVATGPGTAAPTTTKASTASATADGQEDELMGLLP